MSIDQITPEALKLPTKDRALLAAALWESIEDPFALKVDPTDADAIALAVARDRQIESGSVRALDHHELMARLRR